MVQHPGSHIYRLQFTEDDQGQARDIEFEARGADMALEIAHKFCGSKSVTMFEDGRRLADLKFATGFWKLD